MGIAELRALHQARKPDETWSEYRKLAALGEADTEAHWIGALAARARNRPIDARWVLEQYAMPMGPTGNLLGQIRLTLAEVLRGLGEILPAIAMMETWLEEAPTEYPDLIPVARPYCHFNLGLAYRQVSDAAALDRSIAHYQTACDGAKEAGLTNLLMMALHNMAWAACIKGDTVLAIEALDEAEGLCHTSADWAHQRLGRIHVLVMDCTDDKGALIACEELCQPHSNSPADVMSHATTLAGEIAYRNGLYQQAHQLARRAIDYAVQAGGENRCLKDAAELCKRVAAKVLEAGS